MDTLMTLSTIIKRPAIRRVASCDPGSFDQSPAQPLIAHRKESTVIGLSSRSRRCVDQAHIDGKLPRMIKTIDRVDLESRDCRQNGTEPGNRAKKLNAVVLPDMHLNLFLSLLYQLVQRLQQLHVLPQDLSVDAGQLQAFQVVNAGLAEKVRDGRQGNMEPVQEYGQAILDLGPKPDQEHSLPHHVPAQARLLARD